MIVVFTQFVLSGFVVVLAGTTLSRSADRIADLTGFGRLLVGSVLLAGATSLPELSVGVYAVRTGHADVAVGGVVGSSLFNLLILGLVDLVHRSGSRMFSQQAASHALSATGTVLLTSLVAIGILLGPRLSDFAVGGVGVESVAILAAYLLSLRLVYRNQMVQFAKEGEAVSEPSPGSEATLTGSLLRFGAAAVVIVLAAPYLADSAAAIADRTGLGETFVGTACVALCTSLPELVASVPAVRLGAFDLAAGNVFGSNAFNMLLLVPLDLASETPLLADVAPAHAVTCLCSVVVTAVAVMGQLYEDERRTRLVEPDATLVILLVLGSLGIVYALSSGRLPLPAGL